MKPVLQLLLSLIFVVYFLNYISVFQFIWKYVLYNYQMHNFEQKMVASFAMNLEISYSVFIKAFKTILASFGGLHFYSH